jgi:hypothetical protein
MSQRQECVSSCDETSGAPFRHKTASLTAIGRQHNLSSRAICSRECLLVYISQLNAIRWNTLGVVLRSSSAEDRGWPGARDPIISEKHQSHKANDEVNQARVRATCEHSLVSSCQLACRGFQPLPRRAATQASLHIAPSLQEKSEHKSRSSIVLWSSPELHCAALLCN